MELGLYRNNASAELHVVGPANGFNTLGGIYEAEARDDIFGGKVYLVSPQSMADAGYQLVESDAGKVGT